MGLRIERTRNEDAEAVLRPLLAVSEWREQEFPREVHLHKGGAEAHSELWQEEVVLEGFLGGVLSKSHVVTAEESVPHNEQEGEGERACG